MIMVDRIDVDGLGMEFGEALGRNTYPGRLLLVGRATGGELLCAYALTGRSEASRARRLHLDPGSGLVVRALDDRPHDALRHYPAAVTVDERHLVLGNGEQVSTIADRLARGDRPETAVQGIDYEPDPPIHTPRISAVVSLSDESVCVTSARRPAGRRGDTDVRTLTARGLEPGDALTVCTYRSDGVDVRADAVPIEVAIAAADAEELLRTLWDALSPRYRIAAAVFPAGRLGDALIVHA
jgi:IMP cyclohydrolase